MSDRRAHLNNPAIAEMAAHSRFVLWRTTREDGGKPRKIPLQADGKKKAASNNPASWCRLDQAEDARDRLAVKGEPVDGIGIMLGKLKDGRWLVGADLDLCRSFVTGAIEPWARRVIDRCATYAEISPSGTGVKLCGYVSQPPPCMWDGKKFAGKEVTPPGWTMRPRSGSMPSFGISPLPASTWKARPTS
jgi:hypothetical protein